MKKVLFLFAFLLLGIGAMAQKVIYDETNQTGVRTVVCEGMNLGAVSYTHLPCTLHGWRTGLFVCLLHLLCGSTYLLSIFSDYLSCITSCIGVFAGSLTHSHWAGQVPGRILLLMLRFLYGNADGLESLWYY